MTSHINSASRLVAILRQSSTFPGNAVVLDNWAKILGVSEENPYRKAILVATQLGAMNDELELLAAQMGNTPIKPEKYIKHFRQVEHALSPMLLQGSWNQVQQFLTSEVISVLEIYQDILPDEESIIDANAFNEIEALLKELEEALDSDGLPERVKLLLERHIGIIREAMQQYRVKGVKSLQRAVREGLGDVIAAKSDIKEGVNHKAVKVLAKLWGSLTAVADAADKAKKVYSLGVEAWTSIGPLLDHFKDNK